jgi:protein-L-isoaspartate(D-aspartate) O-methyltransferase
MTTAPRVVRLLMELRQEGIRDTAVLSAIERTPREIFLPETLLDQAYENTALPIESGQTISQPLVVAAMTEALELTGRERVLEIGTGSGYQAAVLSALCRRVYTVERHANLMTGAVACFERLGLTNVVTRVADGSLGWPEAAPFERIIVTAAAPEIPPALLDQLKPDGILVIPVGRVGAGQELLKIRRTEAGFEETAFMPVRFVPLVPGATEEGA